jgi:hypothetical protein
MSAINRAPLNCVYCGLDVRSTEARNCTDARCRQHTKKDKMSLECSVCEMDLRAGDDETCTISNCPSKQQKVVKHPPHYGGDTPHEVIKCLSAWGLESDALLWNAVKYIARHGKKGDPLTDLEKARFYLDRRIAQLKEDKPK